MPNIKFYTFSLLFVASAYSHAQIIPYDSELIETNYATEIENHRITERQSFRNKKTTLLSDEFFPRFTGLNYFPADLKFRIVAKLIPLSKTERIDLDMSNGGPYGFVHYGKVSFSIDGKIEELQVYEYPSREPTASSIFVPFRDKTTGKESYGGGRFLIINIPEDDQIVLDFNLAINPICVYDVGHPCPLPPPSNRLPLRITAGAMMYHDPEDSAAQG